MRATASAASSRAVPGEQDVCALDTDRRQEEAIADLARHALGVVERLGGEAGSPPAAGPRRRRSPSRSRPDAARAPQPVARAQQLSARPREVAGHRVEDRDEAAHAELGEAVPGDEGQQLDALGPRLRAPGRD
jgi:hypothetical protein